jgi:hypothetical protein
MDRKVHEETSGIGSRYVKELEDPHQETEVRDNRCGCNAENSQQSCVVTVACSPTDQGELADFKIQSVVLNGNMGHCR